MDDGSLFMGFARRINRWFWFAMNYEPLTINKNK
jgi:hypothetical protein